MVLGVLPVGVDSPGLAGYGGGDQEAEGSILVTRMYCKKKKIGNSRFQSPGVVMRPSFLDTRHPWSL